MNSKQLKKYIAGQMKAYVELKAKGAKFNMPSIFLKGKAGGGKSSSILAAVEELRKYGRNTGNESLANCGYVDIRLVNYTPGDLSGFRVPDTANGRMITLPANEIPFNQTGFADTLGVIVLEELNLVAPSMQALAYQVTNDRRIGQFDIPEGWIVLATGNLQSDGASTFQMGGPLRNRFIMLDYQNDLDDWLTEFAYNYGVHPSIIGFLKTNPHLLNDNTKVLTEDNMPSERAWTKVSDQLFMEHTADIESEVVAGSIGASTATTFRAWKASDLNQFPSVDELLRPGAKYEISKANQMSAAYMIPAAIISFYKANKKLATPSEILAIYNFIEKLDDEELAAAAWKEMFRNGVKLQDLTDPTVKTRYNVLASRIKSIQSVSEV